MKVSMMIATTVRSGLSHEGVHGEWIGVKQGAQGDRESEVFRSTQQCMKSGVAKHLGVARIHQHNWLVNETNVALFAKVRCFLIQSGLSKVFWAEDTTMSKYLVNRSPSSAIGFKKPIDMLGVFYWLASIEQGMLELVKAKCIFLGYYEIIMGNKLWRLDEVTSKVVLFRNMGFNESGGYKKTFISSGVGTGSMQVLQRVEFEVEPQEDHTFKVEPHGNVDHVDGSQEVQTQDLMDYQLARDRDQHLAYELFGYKEDSNEAAFAVATVDKIYAHESLTFNDTVSCEVISKWKAGLKEDMDVQSNAEIWVTKGLLVKAKGNVLGVEIIRDQSGNTLRVSQSSIHNEKLVQTLLKGHSTLSLEDSLSGDYDVEKNGKWSYIYTVGSQEYQMVCTRHDIVSIGMDMLDGFDRGLQTNVQGFVDFNYAMGRSITHMEALSTTVAGSMTFTEACKKEIWLKRPLTEWSREGPDGFSFDFICTFWDILKHDFVNAIREFFISSKFPPGCNSSFIALIPKKHDAKFVKDYRPISLIGCFYKIVSKILANRLRMVISELISDVQSAFVSNRQILDGPFILNELISWCKAHKSKAMIFKVDFEKAFDSVRWDFLDIILRNFGFGIKWRGWIQGCLSSAMGSILVNGSPTAEFKFHKGLKQGDPLSPYLFILVMESLHLSFNNIINADLFKGIRFDDSLTLSHLFYADDAVFIGKWDRANILTIVRMLKCFFLASGLQINILKSKLMGIGVSNEEVLAAANIIGCSTFSTPFSYLGVKVGMSPSRRKAWDEIIGKVSNRLSKWKIKTLSVGGRLTLIKSVLTSLPLYHMSLYKAPLGVLRDLESLRRKFFNGADINEKRFSMISWNKILASKQKGGLGVSSFFALNRSLLFKWVWRFLSQDASLWHRLIAVLYGNRSPFVHTGSVSSLSPWNCILKELNSLSAKGINLLALLKKKVGNGANTLFWEDCWINDVPLSRSFPRLYALELKKGITVADKLIDASFVASFRRNPRGGVEEEQLHHLVELVGSISLSPSNDRWAWLLGSSGEFSVHSARTFIDDILLPFVGDVTRWVKVVPIKVNILAWKVCLDKLPTRLNLSLRGIDIPSIICPNCGLAGESCSHLFYSCNLARTLWRKIARWWEIDIPDFSCYEEWIAWFKTTRFSKAQKEMLEGVFYVMWWMIWKFRNQVLFGSSHPRMELLFDDIVSYSFTWCSNRCKNNIDWISWMKCPKSISL
ncbi:RNA-directed DNA polymerase, eukaryota [Tanacetum coccineum]